MPECAWHPGVETSLSCPDCGRYICPKDMVDTPVGYKCKECGRAGKPKLGGVKPGQLVRAAGFGLAAAVVGGVILGLVPFLSLFGSFFYGALVGEATRRGGSGHRTWEFAVIAAVTAVLGAFVGGFVGRFQFFPLVIGPIVAVLFVTTMGL